MLKNHASRYIFYSLLMHMLFNVEYTAEGGNWLRVSHGHSLECGSIAPGTAYFISRISLVLRNVMLRLVQPVFGLSDVGCSSL